MSPSTPSLASRAWSWLMSHEERDATPQSACGYSSSSIIRTKSDWQKAKVKRRPTEIKQQQESWKKIGTFWSKQTDYLYAGNHRAHSQGSPHCTLRCQAEPQGCCRRWRAEKTSVPSGCAAGWQKAGCSASKTKLRICFLKAGEEEIKRSRQMGKRSLSICIKISQATDFPSSSLSHWKNDMESLGLLHFSWHVIYPTENIFL